MNFCSYAGNKSVLVETIQNFSIPVYSKFTQKVLNMFKEQVDLKEMMIHCPTMLLVYHEDREALNFKRASSVIQKKDFKDKKDADD